MSTVEQKRTVASKVWNEPLARMAIVIAPLLATGIADQKLGLRNLLPEPIDVFDHVGNAMPSAALGYTAAYGMIVAATYTRNERFRERSRRAAIAAGFCIGLVVNTIVESRTGGIFSDLPNTPDALDAAYGVMGATIAAAMVPIIHTRATGQKG